MSTMTSVNELRAELARAREGHTATHERGWVFALPNGRRVSVIPDPRQPLHFEVQTDDPANAGTGGIVAALTTDQVLAKLATVATLPPPEAKETPQMRTCTNPNHDHTTYQDRDGNSLDAPIPMRCNHDGHPTHYDSGIESYQHDDPNTADCFLVKRRNDASACTWEG